MILALISTQKDFRLALRAVFEPGTNAKGVYNGLDPLLDASTQGTLIAGGTMAIYNRSTLSRNQYFPGVLINAAEVSFLASEYYLKNGNVAAAKTAYEAGIKQSVEYFYKIRTISNDNTAGPLTATSNAEIAFQEMVSIGIRPNLTPRDWH